MGELEDELWQPGVGAVLDIGGDTGALVLYTAKTFADREIELSRLGDERRVHTAIHPRRVGETVAYAGVYPDLPAGSYRIWVDEPGLPNQLTIVGGQATELDWRSPRASGTSDAPGAPGSTGPRSGS
jgi:hypothetical protein